MSKELVTFGHYSFDANRVISVSPAGQGRYGTILVNVNMGDWTATYEITNVPKDVIVETINKARTSDQPTYSKDELELRKWSIEQATKIFPNLSSHIGCIEAASKMVDFVISGKMPENEPKR